ncbi:coiled-coil-helix-coiled-coil-helix domain-containing protein 5-like [Ostrea edulis]|uniref:coiled-coil-helix-coiled-coil-helix domain-containing protein 5-like n=1 Tax=Ostrea edulis TaxID=37623 RepID=UPI0024AF12DB|nr:coiled-coil-helix-coiled-coil-helix domain-containing protein 5-like [Ostrea edulis]
MSNIAAILAEKHCQRYLRGFTDCVNEFPETWHLDCENQRLKLQRCLQSNEAVVKIKEKCAPEFSIYEDCISKNPQEMAKCLSEFQSFISCADKVADKT